MTAERVGSGLVVLHYTAPSFAGGVESLLADFLALTSELGRGARLVVGKGKTLAVSNSEVVEVPLLDADHPRVRSANRLLLDGQSTEETDQLCDEVTHELSRVIRRGDVIHVYNVVVNSFNLPLVIALHRFMVARTDVRMLAWCFDPFSGSGPIPASEYERHPLNLLTRLWPRTQYLVPSEYARQRLQGMAAVPHHRVSVVPPFIDIRRELGLSDQVARLAETSGLLTCDVSLLCSSRMARRKNLELALEITRVIKDMHRSVRLLVTAPSSPHHPEQSEAYRSEILATVEKLGLMEDVFIINSGAPGAQSNSCLNSADVAALHRLVDVVLSTSLWEGYGLSGPEAVLQRTPILLSSAAAVAVSPSDGIEVFELGAEVPYLARRVLDLADRGAARKGFLRRYADRANYLGTLENIPESLLQAG